MIGGYSRSEVRGKPFSSLLLGTFEDGKLIYAGKVGTGFDAARFRPLAKFEPLERATSPFVEVPRAERKDAVWLEPKLVGADRLHRMDARRAAAGIRASRAARGQTGARGPSRARATRRPAWP